MGKWEMVRLGDICVNLDYMRVPITASERKQGQYPYYGASGIVDYVENYIFDEELLLVSEDGANLLARVIPIAFSISGKVWVNNHVHILRFQNIATQKYCERYINNIDISCYVTGSAQPKLNQANLVDISIPLPPLPLQQQIADVLDCASTLIEKRKAQIEKLDLLIKSQFIEMFGDPVTNPMGWEVRKLKDITTIVQSGNTPKGGKQVYVNSGIMFFRSQNVWRNRMELDDIAYIDEKTHKKMSQTRLKHKDILITKTGRFNTENSSLGRAALFLGEDDSANINGHVYLVRLKVGIVHEFVLYILITDEYRDYIRKVCVGGIDKRQINKEHLEEFPIIMPPVELQHKFANFFLQIEAQKSLLQQSLAKMELNYKSLMQKCFRGEIF